MNFFSSQKSTPLQAFGNERRDLKRNAGNKNCPEKKPLSPFVPELFQMNKNLPSSKCEHMFLLPKGSAVCILQVHHPFGLVLGKNSNASLATGLLFFFCVFFRVQKGLIDAINSLTDNFAPSDFGNDMSFAISEFFCIAFGKPYLKPQTFWVFCWSSCTYRLYHLLVWYVHSIK